MHGAVRASAPLEISRFRASAYWRCIAPDWWSFSTDISSITSWGAREILSLWADLERVKLLHILQQVAIPRERVQRKIIPVKVIFQIKDARETGARKLLFVPGTIGILLLEQVPHGVGHCRIVFVGRGQKANQAPCGLRRSAGALPLYLWIVVRRDRFAEAAVVVLDCTQPRHGTLAIIASVEGNRF